MRFFRSTWGSYLTVFVLATSLFPVAFAPSAQAAERIAAALHENWWQRQAHEGTPSEARDALAASPISRLTLYDDYLGAFVRAHDGRSSVSVSAHRFTGPFYLIPEAVRAPLHLTVLALAGPTGFHYDVRVIDASRPQGP